MPFFLMSHDDKDDYVHGKGQYRLIMMLYPYELSIYLRVTEEM